jgi:hypothetical protein
MGAPWAGVTTPPYASFGFDVHTLLQLFDLEASHTQLCRALQQRELAFITIAFVATRIILPQAAVVLSSTPNLREIASRHRQQPNVQERDVTVLWYRALARCQV